MRSHGSITNIAFFILLLGSIPTAVLVKDQKLSDAVDASFALLESLSHLKNKQIVLGEP